MDAALERAAEAKRGGPSRGQGEALVAEADL
jgi:hypothetical protein